jgi:hypothetical protein
VSIALLSSRDKDGLNGRRVLDVVRQNESAEYVAYFPRWAALFDRVTAAFRQLAAQLQQTYNAIAAIPEDAAFAQAAARTPQFSGALFAMRRKQLTALQALRSNPPTPKLYELLLPLMPALPPELAAATVTDDANEAEVEETE